jgi:hypothetical protein
LTIIINYLNGMGFSMENFLYKCELCTTAKLSTWDKDEVWFIDCVVCKSMQFHHKVIVRDTYTLTKYIFECKMDKEVVDDDKEKPSFKL